MSTQTQNTVESLKKILGGTFRLYVQTHGYHWNVEGPDFRQLHAAFEEQYTNLWEALDEVAERIRALGAYAPGSVTELMALAGPEAGPVQSANDMVKALLSSHEGVAAELRGAIKVAQAAEDEVTVGMLTDRLEWHEKEMWMMRAGQA
ncbi:Dps family protein [Xanthobacter sp. TB0139]|uniref:Dps family protein n=1 Tax=Xanthobacter sp. TB0139 TaxID=3459178 RepID=UPI004039354F